MIESDRFEPANNIVPVRHRFDTLYVDTCILLIGNFRTCGIVVLVEYALDGKTLFGGC